MRGMGPHAAVRRALLQIPSHLASLFSIVFNHVESANHLRRLALALYVSSNHLSGAERGKPPDYLGGLDEQDILAVRMIVSRLRNKHKP